jgi:hypothetical protein
MNSRRVLLLWTVAIACVCSGCGTNPFANAAKAKPKATANTIATAKLNGTKNKKATVTAKTTPTPNTNTKVAAASKPVEKATTKLKLAAPTAKQAPTAPRTVNPEYVDFAKEIEKTVATADANAISDKFDWEALLATAGSGLGLSSKVLRNEAAAFKKEVRKPGAIVAVLASTKKQNGSFQLLNVQEAKRGATALYRVLQNKDGGLNYVRFSLTKQPSGQIRVIDIYNFMSGENVSQTIRRSAIIPLVAHQSRGLLARLSGIDNDTMKSHSVILALIQSVRSGRGEEALDLYYKLPPSLQTDKTYLLLRLTAAQVAGDQPYAKAIDACRAAYPNDRSVDLISIDGFLGKKQYAEAIKCIDRLDKSVGGDPYLKLIRAGTGVLMGDLAIGKASAEDAIRADPTLIGARRVLIMIALKENALDKALGHVRIIERDFPSAVDPLGEFPGLVEFIKTPEYKEWLNAHPVAPTSAKELSSH